MSETGMALLQAYSENEERSGAFLLHENGRQYQTSRRNSLQSPIRVQRKEARQTELQDYLLLRFRKAGF